MGLVNCYQESHGPAHPKEWLIQVQTRKENKGTRVSPQPFLKKISSKLLLVY